MPTMKIKKEVRAFLGRINYISCSISKLTATCEPLFKLLKKNKAMVWDDDGQIVFEKIKTYMLNPPVLVPQGLGVPP